MAWCGDKEWASQMKHESEGAYKSIRAEEEESWPERRRNVFSPQWNIAQMTRKDLLLLISNNLQLISVLSSTHSNGLYYVPHFSLISSSALTEDWNHSTRSLLFYIFSEAHQLVHDEPRDWKMSYKMSLLKSKRRASRSYKLKMWIKQNKMVKVRVGRLALQTSSRAKEFKI